jgi:hypothetical protein
MWNNGDNDVYEIWVDGSHVFGVSICFHWLHPRRWSKLGIIPVMWEGCHWFDSCAQGEGNGKKHSGMRQWNKHHDIFFHGVRVYFQLFQTTNLRWLVQVKKHFGMVGSISSQWIIAGQYTYLLPYTTCSTNLISSCHQLVRVNSWGSQGHDFQPRVNISQSIPLYPSITISYCIPIYVGEVMLNPNPIKHISVLFGSGGVLGY